jgi:hypothetical protein
LATATQPELSAALHQEQEPGRTWQDRFKKILASPWTQAVATTLLGLLLAWAGEHVHIYFQKRPFHAVWDHILRDQRTVPVVIGGLKRPVFQPIHVERLAQLPKNVPLVGVQEAIGISLLREELVGAFGSNSIGLYEAEEFGADKTRSSFISVGGSSINEVTYDLLVQRKLDTKFRMIYPDHYAVDGADGITYRAEQQDGLITKDYGFIIVGPNPYDSQKTVCLAFGIWPQGTSAAIEALIRPDSVSPLGTQFIAKVKQGKGVVAVVETRVTGLQQGRPTFVKVRDLAVQ